MPLSYTDRPNGRKGSLNMYKNNIYIEKPRRSSGDGRRHDPLHMAAGQRDLAVGEGPRRIM